LFILEQRGPTSFNLRAILQKLDNLWATSKKIIVTVLMSAVACACTD